MFCDWSKWGPIVTSVLFGDLSRLDLSWVRPRTLCQQRFIVPNHTNFSTFPLGIMMLGIVNALWVAMNYFCQRLSVAGCLCLSVCPCVNHDFVHPIACHPFKLEPPNLDQRCKTNWKRSYLTSNFQISFMPGSCYRVNIHVYNLHIE